MPGTPLNIKDQEAHQLASMIAQHTGKTLTRVVVDALRREKERVVPRQVNMRRIHEILASVDAMPVLDQRPAAAIMADLYDEKGMPK